MSENIVRSIHQDVFFFIRTQGLRLVLWTSPVVLLISFWQNYLAYTGASSTEAMEQWLSHMLSNSQSWLAPPLVHIQLREILPSLVADLLFTAMVILGIDRCARPQPGASLGALWAWALERGPALFVAQLLADLIIGMGLLFFILPAVYLSGRLLLVSLEVMLETPGRPIESIKASWQHSKGQVTSILGGYVVWVLLRYVLLIAVLLALHVFAAVDQPHSLAGWLSGSFRQAMSMWLQIPTWIFLYRVRERALQHG